MAVSEKLKQFLDGNKVKYQIATHPEVYTAQEIAAELHVPGKELVKVVIVNAQGNYVMTALPASWRIEMEKLREIVGVKEMKLATEDEFKNLFPDCEIGAMPPFGNLYGLDVYVDKSLAEDEEIVFQAGNHRESIKMKCRDFLALVKPKIAEFGAHPH